MSKFIQCKNRYGTRWPETGKLDENGKVVNGKDGKPIRLPEVFLPEAEKNMVIMISDEQIQNLEQSSVFRDLMAKGDYVYHDKMPESAKNDAIRLMERDAELDAAKLEIERLKSKDSSVTIKALDEATAQLTAKEQELADLKAQLEAKNAELEAAKNKNPKNGDAREGSEREGEGA